MKSPNTVERFLLVADRLESRLLSYWSSLMGSEGDDFRTFLAAVRRDDEGLEECAALLQLDFDGTELARKLKPFATLEEGETFSARLPEMAVLQMMMFPKSKNMSDYFAWLRAIIEVHAIRESVSHSMSRSGFDYERILARRGFELVARIERDGEKFCLAFYETPQPIVQRRVA